MAVPLKLLPNIPVIVAATFDSKAWTDPWGLPSEGYTITAIRRDLMDTGRRIERDIGYGPENMAHDRIWITERGHFMRELTNPIDYYGRSTFAYCTEAGEPIEPGDASKVFYEKPVKGRRYVYQGGPWTPEEN